VLEAACAGLGPEQGVQRARRLELVSPCANVDGSSALPSQTVQRFLDGLPQACSRLAGGCSQRHAQGLGLGLGLWPELVTQALQQHQQARSNVGLAGAGATGDDGERASQRQSAGHLLPIGFCGAVRRNEQPVEQAAGTRPVNVKGHSSGPGRDLLRHPRLVTPMAAQIQQAAAGHQR